jgi:hypothetical protein
LGGGARREVVSQENLWINEQKGKGNDMPSFPYVHFADYVVDHKVNFVEVAKSVGESKKDLIDCGAIGHQGVHASGPVAFLINENSPGFSYRLQRPNTLLVNR